MQKNKIIISIDGIRKDRIGIYNSKADYLTPNINRISKESVIFDDMLAAATSTGMCFSSIFTGKAQKEFKRRNYGDTFNPFDDNIFTDHESLGYKTFVCLNERFKVHHKLINTFGNAEHWWTGNINQNKNIGSLSPIEQIQFADSKIKKLKEPFLLWIHLWGFSKPKDKFLELTPFDYDARVAELDEAIGLAFDLLRNESEMYFFSDHGYAFFEKKKWGYGKDGENLTEPVCSVPFIAYKNDEKGRNPNLISQLSIRKIISSNEEISSLKDDTAFCESRYIDQTDRALAIRIESMKLIYYFYNDKYEFYDLRNDHNESIDYASKTFNKFSRNINGQHPEDSPYIIRNDWNNLYDILDKSLNIARNYYQEGYTIKHKLKEFIKRNFFLFTFYSFFQKK